MIDGPHNGELGNVPILSQMSDSQISDFFTGMHIGSPQQGSSEDISKDSILVRLNGLFHNRNIPITELGMLWTRRFTLGTKLAEIFGTSIVWMIDLPWGMNFHIDNNPENDLDRSKVVRFKKDIKNAIEFFHSYAVRDPEGMRVAILTQKLIIKFVVEAKFDDLPWEEVRMSRGNEALATMDVVDIIGRSGINMSPGDVQPSLYIIDPAKVVLR